MRRHRHGAARFGTRQSSDAIRPVTPRGPGCSVRRWFKRTVSDRAQLHDPVGIVAGEAEELLQQGVVSVDEVQGERRMGLLGAPGEQNQVVVEVALPVAQLGERPAVVRGAVVQALDPAPVVCLVAPSPARSGPGVGVRGRRRGAPLVCLLRCMSTQLPSG